MIKIQRNGTPNGLIKNEWAINEFYMHFVFVKKRKNNNNKCARQENGEKEKKGILAVHRTIRIYRAVSFYSIWFNNNYVVHE